MKCVAILILLAGCVDPIPGERMHRAIADCEANGGVKDFWQPGNAATLKVRCENGATFYYGLSR